MLKKLFIFGVFLAHSVTSFALTPPEKTRFKAKVENMSPANRGGLIASNLGGIVLSCPVESFFVIISFLSQTVPLVNKIDSDNEDIYGYTGGLPALITDIYTWLMDLSSNAHMDEPFFKETLKAYKKSLDSLDLDGHCSNQVQQLIILLFQDSNYSPKFRQLDPYLAN